MKILITCAAGFVGFQVAKKIQATAKQARNDQNIQ